MEQQTKHLSFDALTDLAEKSARRTSDQSSSETLENNHLNSCQSCQTQFVKLTQSINLMRNDDAVDAPAELISQAVALFRTRPIITKEPAPSVLKRLLAVLSFDSLELKPAFGLRSGALSSNTRQMLYSAGEYDLDLRITPNGEKWVVSGQLLGDHCDGGQIALVTEHETSQTDLNDLCEFTLPPVASGHYQLRLNLPQTEIDVPDFQLGL